MSGYGSFLAFAAVLVLVPGPDTAVVVRSTLTGGRRRGTWSALGITASNAVQGTAAAAGLAAVVVRAEPLFQAIRWAGIAYLTYLGVQSLRSALRGRYPASDEGASVAGVAVRGFRQGFLSNITNPKVLAFYLAVLPQFLGEAAAVPVLLAFALTHAVIGLAWSLVLVTGLHRSRAVLDRRSVRRSMDALTGCALLGFGARLAVSRG
ncbi:LysE family translocator [Trujillonella endophytica]|uniref:Threonine/homoserine/homoserine lactone efflux protein n=1 Tax=Trujillonella endophytica TaxID=673521 RepID=A0A1H8SCL7_9ACTN|nr:LysE family translocator [Trujillella endophytica]SEO76307.1 Threonine/homoserine/homoserine lactone efflux protein [Trujillella endophytica]